MINQIHLSKNTDLFNKMAESDVKFDLCYADMMFDEKSKPELQWIKELRKCAAEFSTIYIHTDQRSVCEVKKAIEDFGWHFQSWLIWPYNWGGRSNKMWGKKHDDIIVATMHSKKWTFNVKAIQIPKKTLINTKKTHQIPTNVWCDSDVWEDIGILHTMSKEKNKGKHRKWQKPERLLERIIKASSNKGDLVLDPFCGTGTTCDVAEQLERDYISCDTSVECVNITNERLGKVKR